MNEIYETIPTAGMSRKEWLRLRKTGIGGSDAGAICGLNPYSSAMSVYMNKTTDEAEEQEGEQLRQGRDLEEYVARRFCEATGFKVRRSNMMYRSKEHPFMIADVDRLVMGADAGLECKTASAYSADKWKDGNIPLHYLMQCYHYMAVTGKRTWYIAVVILGTEFKFAKIEWDDTTIRSLIRLEEAFWYRNVLPRIMPDPDGSKACDEILEQYFHISRKAMAVPLVGFDEKLRHREDIVAQAEELERERKQIEQEIKLYMGDHEDAYADGYRVSWSSVETARVDTKRLKKERPEIYREFSNTTSSRRFAVRAVQEQKKAA